MDHLPVKIQLQPGRLTATERYFSFYIVFDSTTEKLLEDFFYLLCLVNLEKVCTFVLTGS